MENIKECSVCFTGHRQILPHHMQLIPQRLEYAISWLTRQGFTNFIAGGAVGFDMLAAEAVLRARQCGAGVTLFLALPCRDQTARWKNPHTLARYERLIREADDVFYLQEAYTATCMHARNRFMVDHSAVCMAYYNNGGGGGTAYTIRYAEKQGLPIVNLANSNYMFALAED